MHFQFISPFDQPDYTPQEGDTWHDLRDTTFATADGSVRAGRGMVARKFIKGEWVEYDPLDDYPADIRALVEDARRHRSR